MNEAKKPDFELTGPEKDLLARIRFNTLALPDYDAEQRNGNAVCALMKSLLKRDAIPKQRILYFVHPDYNPGGRGKSLKERFERNGCRGDDIHMHPHFLEYLQYFLFGPDLPPLVSRDFREAISDYREINASNISALKRAARNIAAAYELNGEEVCDGFYKVALDCGVKYWLAQLIRTAIRKLH